jgi:transcriptional antiterminator NusG
VERPAIGQLVTVTEGPFQGFVGRVDDVNVEMQKVKVAVAFFGRETAVELNFREVRKASSSD